MKRAVDADDIDSLTQIAELVNQISKRMKQIPKPVIMVADGAVAGATANMAVAAAFVLLLISQVYSSLCWGRFGSRCWWSIPFRKSHWLTRATQLAMTGEPLGAEKALEYGVVYKVSEVEKLDKTANQLLMKLDVAQTILLLRLRSWHGLVC